MAQEIEIEFKHLLTKDQFTQIKDTLPFSNEPIVQTNYYFETTHKSFIKNKCALRIREINNSYTATFKEPHPEGILETHDSLSKQEAHVWMNKHVTCTENVGRRINMQNIPLSDIQYIGSLTTKRYTYTKGKLLYVLDESSYGDTIDYELEIEATSFREGEHAHQQIIEQFQLSNQEPITKIERFLHSIN